MQHEILYRPSYSLVKVTLAPNERINAEASAMVSMSSGTQIETGARGGIMKSLLRSVLGGESFFTNSFWNPSGGEVTFAPTLPGDISQVSMSNETLLVQSGSFLCCADGVAMDVGWGGAKGFFSSEGLILLKATGTGDLFLSSYGAIHDMTLAPGERYIVDTGHLVAFTANIGYQVQRVGGIKSTLFSGEGLVVELTGPGRVYMQTRSVDSFLNWLLPKLPKPDSRG